MPYILSAGGTIGRLHLNPPAKCDLCQTPITTEFYDARTISGKRANLCPSCFTDQDCNLGVGFGQRFSHISDKALQEIMSK